MAVPGLSEIVTTTIQRRNKKIVDNILGNNALLSVLKDKDHVKMVGGGDVIVEELRFAENNNGGWFEGFDILPTAHNDTLSAAQFDWKQLACPVVSSGRDKLRNSGPERMIDLADARVESGQTTMMNLMSAALYSDGTGQGGKQLGGLGLLVPLDPTTGTVGGINRATWTFWRPYALDTGAAPSAATIRGIFNQAMANLTRGRDKPDLVVTDDDVWLTLAASFQELARFTQPSSKLASMGFNAFMWMGAEVVMDSGIGGDATDVTAYFLNTDYIYLRTHTDYNFTASAARQAFNQDASVVHLLWAGAFTTSFSRAQGRVTFNA